MPASQDRAFHLPRDQQRADFLMLQIAAVNMFTNREAFEDARARLRALDYAEIYIRFETLAEFHRLLSEGLRWREQFGYEPWTGNLDALHDAFHEPPSFSRSGGLVVAIDDFHRLAKADRRGAAHLLDIIEYQSRNHLLCGRRLIGLFRSDKYRDAADTKLGCRGPNWHDKTLPRLAGLLPG